MDGCRNQAVARGATKYRRPVFDEVGKMVVDQILAAVVAPQVA